MTVCFETHGHEDKFWNLGPMPSVDNFYELISNIERSIAANAILLSI